MTWPRKADDADGGGSPLPPGMVLAGAWAWRILAIVAVLAVIVYCLSQITIIVIPLMIAVLISALLVPFSSFLQAHGWPKWVAIVVTLLVVLVILAALVLLVVTQVIDGIPTLRRRSFHSYRDIKGFLTGSPFHLDESNLTAFYRDGVKALQADSKSLLSGAVTVGSAAGHFLAGLLLTVFATLILLIDGKSVWRWTVRLFPRRARPAVDGAGQVGWVTLKSFVKVQIFVAFVDGVGIGVIAAILHVPLAVPIGVAVFLGSFIPVVGAVFTGIISVFVALVFNGWVIALFMLAGVLLIHVVEGHVLQPLVMGSAVRVHPLAVVFAVAGGSLLAGIAGALFAVPVVAVANVMVTFVASGRWRTVALPGDRDVPPRNDQKQEGVVDV